MTEAAVTITRSSPSEILVEGPPAVLTEWRQAHRFKVPGYKYMPRYRNGDWDGTWAPGRWARRDGSALRLSVGLAPRIARDLGLAWAPQVPVKIDTDKYLPSADARLRDYQHEALVKALTHGWGRIALATNAGKGAIIALIAATLRDHGLVTTILCDEVAVYDALCGELRQWGGRFPFAEVRAGVEAVPEAQVTLAMVQTLTRRVEDETEAGDRWGAWLAQQDALLLDEADKATSSSWRTLLKGARAAWWRIGFSGTFPSDKYSDVRYDELMGPVLVQKKNLDLVDRGISARPLIELHSYDVTDSLHGISIRGLRGAAQRARIYDRAVTTNTTRHAAIANLLRPGAQTAVVVNRIAHGVALAQMLPDAVFLDGSATPGERIAALEAFGRGEIPTIVVTKILDRGTNRLGPATDLIFASGEGSERQALQRIGRGLRRGPDGKVSLRLVDIVDRVRCPDTARATDPLKKASNYLHGAARRRIQLYADEGFEVTISQ